MDNDESPQIELIDPGDVVVKIILGENEDCPPCEQIRKHIEKYPGKYQIIDPMDPTTEQFWKDDQIELPIATIERPGGEEVPCEVFMDDENLVLKCDGKLLVIAEPEEPAEGQPESQPQP